MPKRKASTTEQSEVTPRRSARQKISALDVAPSSIKEARPGGVDAKKVKNAKSKSGGKDVSKPAENTKAPKDRPTPSKQVKPKTAVETGHEDSSSEKQYWLMKAEPETRLENGVDVKFSIDDLAAKTEPEPWDGIRAYPARNNMRAMKKGDLAFFYHSNCKEPGIAGIMEIVQEHSPDLSAHNPKAPYYDASSKPSDPKWSVVHVEFRTKFDAPITLKQLREMGTAGKPLEGMQMLKQSRLSVSRVSASEWEYLMGVVEERSKQ